MLFMRKAASSHGLLSVVRRQLTTEVKTVENTARKKYNDTALKKWAIVSPLVNPSQMKSQFVTAIEVTPIAATWAVLDSHANEIVDCGTYPLFTEDSKISSFVVLNLAHKVKELLPLSDLYVLEEKSWTRGFQKPNDMVVNLLTFQAMLYTLLNDNFKPDESIPKVFYIQPKAILKLFKLQVGNERVSSQHIIQRMIRRSEVGYTLDSSWENLGSLEVASDHYGQLRWTDPEMIKRIWTRDDLWRENVSNAILSCHAFADLCLKEDSDALRLLWQRKT